jgi:glutathione S-transferase
MELYFAPLACSMASRIAFYEAGAEPRFIQVDTHAKRLKDGADYFGVNPMGQVPALRLDDGTLLTENPAVLHYIADRYPTAALAPAEMEQRAQMRRWLSFIGSELHTAVFLPLLDARAPEGAKEYAQAKLLRPMTVLAAHLAGRDYLLDRFSVADAYLTVVLNWTVATKTDLAQWPVVQAYYCRMLQRPSIARAVAEERVLYAEEQARRAAA